MILAGTRSLLTHDLGAGPRLIVVALTLLAVHVADVVRILLFEFVAVDLLAEFFAPELERLFGREAHALQEKTQLQSTEML